MYKYNALKKKWKEVIDSPYGSETKPFTHKDEFDQLYGTKASTKPQYTIDTDKTERKRQQENVSSEDDNTPCPHLQQNQNLSHVKRLDNRIFRQF
jgi:hypothetical protein